MPDHYRANDKPSSSERWTHGVEVRAVFSDLPRNKQVRYGALLEAWIYAVRMGADQNAMAEGLVRYYKSPQGRGKYARRAHTFINDEGWLEPPEAWGESSGVEDGPNPAGPAKAIDWSECKPLSHYRKAQE